MEREPERKSDDGSLPIAGQKLEYYDASPVSSSRYSSCGESEFERYSSANSVLGTQSLCSSMGGFHDCVDSDFGSVESFGAGESDGFEGFSLGAKFHSSGEDEGCRFSGGSRNWDSDKGVLGGVKEEDGDPSISVEANEELVGVEDQSDFDDGVELFCLDAVSQEEEATDDHGMRGLNNRVGAWQKGVGGMCGSTRINGDRCDGEMGFRFETASSTYEHLEGEHSMFKYVSDDENMPAGYYQEQKPDSFHGADELSESSMSCSTTLADSLQIKETAAKDSVNVSVVSNQLHGDDETEENLQRFAVYDVFAKQDFFTHQAVQGMRSITVGANIHADTLASNSSFPMRGSLEGFRIKDVLEIAKVELCEEKETNSVSSARESNKGSIPNDLNLIEDRDKGKSSELNVFCDEVVDEMEEVLLDSSGSPVGRLSQKNATTTSHSLQPSLLRDGGPTASSSGLNDGYPLIHQPFKIDGIEVVGVRRKRGDVSLSERLVGVKEHTVYVIHVWSGKDQWEVERRYRDFDTLYRKLKSIFSEQGLILPPPWSSVEQESRKLFGNASPDVITERSVLIQECLRSILHYRHSSAPPSFLIWFLYPPKDLPGSPNASVHQSVVAVDAKDISKLGKIISLTVELRPNKSPKQMMELQQYTCAACHRMFRDGKSRVQEFVQTFGWGRPRLCEYTGQLFCSSCHKNDMAVLPARVLHHWDFTEYPVSRLAKSYLDSILDQPMLCVSAVNPLLFSKVPALFYVVRIRNKIAAMLVYVECPFRGNIYRGLRSRRYLLENNDFFALRDLIDLSKGAFAALPVILNTVLKKIEEHITEHCLVCCDVGVPCGAQQACDDPSSLIFPFQEEETIQRCGCCKSVFHKHCFKRLPACPCRAHHNDANKSMAKLRLGAVGDAGGAPPLLGKKSDLTVSEEGFFSHLLSMEEIRFNSIQGISLTSFLRGKTIK